MKKQKEAQIAPILLQFCTDQILNCDQFARGKWSFFTYRLFSWTATNRTAHVSRIESCALP